MAARVALRLVLALAASGAVGGCYDLGAAPEEVTTSGNRCESNADCSKGTCLASGLCSVSNTKLSALLLELRPPTTQERFQGALTYYPLRLNRLQESVLPVTVKYPRAIRGDIALAFGAADCRPSPVVVTFVPVEARLGIDTPRYSTVSEVGTAIVNKRHVDTHKYALSGLPEGTYDVYLEDANLVDNTARPECAVAPYSIRGLTIESEEGASKFVRNLVQGRARSLRVVVPASSPFVGWSVDVIHRQTGELLSSRAVLPVGEDGQGSVDVTLRLSEGDGEEAEDGLESLRLSPPPGQGAPIITLVLAGLEVFERGEALVPDVGALATPVSYQTWVWRSERGGGVPGTVQFVARQLEALPPGVNATFERRTTIESTGLVRVALPPGVYSARVFPEASVTRGLEPNLAVYETEVTVWLPVDGPSGPATSQGGRLIVVPNASTMSGRVTFDNQPPPPGTQVLALGNRRTGRSQPGHRLETYPSSVELVDGDRFQLAGLSCGSCLEGSTGATYDLFVKPTQTSGLPWVIVTGEHVNGRSTRAGDLTIDVPRVAAGVLSVTTNGATVPLPRFSVRAFALLDRAGAPLEETVPRCDELPSADVELACAASVLEVASTRTGDDGSFTLLLPQALSQASTGDAGL